MQTKETPPTYFRNEPIAKGTQAIVDAYGMARYKEFNPAVFSVVTFPFLFGVMYGDIGHGTALLCGGLYLVYSYNPNARLDEMSGESRLHQGATTTQKTCRLI